MAQKIIKEICWGIIGAGDVCEVKSGSALMQIANSSVNAVMRKNSDKAKDFAFNPSSGSKRSSCI